MKQGRKPTRKQKMAIQAARLNPNNRLVTKSVQGQLHIVHRETGRERIIPAA